MATKTTDIATIAPAELPYAIMKAEPREIAAYLREIADGANLSPWSLDIVKVPTGGMTLWMVPDARQGERAEKAIEGIVLYQRTIRSFWSTSLGSGGGNNPPDCSSQDGETGIGYPIGHPDLDRAEARYDANGSEVRRGRFDCASCPLAQFGTRKRDDGTAGRGQACRQNKLLFVAQPKSVLPMIVRVSSASLKPVRQFFIRLAGEGIAPYEIVVRLELEKKANADGVAYAEVRPSFVRDLDPAEIGRIKASLDELRPLFAGARVDAED